MLFKMQAANASSLGEVWWGFHLRLSIQYVKFLKKGISKIKYNFRASSLQRKVWRLNYGNIIEITIQHQPDALNDLLYELNDESAKQRPDKK